MSKKYETNQQILTKDHGQIVLYQRSDHKNPKWQVRIKIDGSTGYTIQSTRTSDVMKATLVATDLYQALVDKFRSTGSTQTRTFKAVVKEWIQHLENKNLNPKKISEFKERLNNYPARLWGDKYIDQIQNSDLEHFIEWRKTHGKHQQTPSLSTIKRDLVPLKGLFRFAYSEKYINNDLPSRQRSG